MSYFADVKSLCIYAMLSVLQACIALPDCGHHCVQSQVKFIYIAHATGVDSMCFKIKSKKHRQMQSYMEKNISDKNIGGIRM